MGLIVISGVGNRTISTLVEFDGQVPAVAVIVNVTVCVLLVLFCKVPEIVDPLPEFDSPVKFIVLFRVQV